MELNKLPVKLPITGPIKDASPNPSPLRQINGHFLFLKIKDKINQQINQLLKISTNNLKYKDLELK